MELLLELSLFILMILHIASIFVLQWDDIYPGSSHVFVLKPIL